MGLLDGRNVIVPTLAHLHFLYAHTEIWLWQSLFEYQIDGDDRCMLIGRGFQIAENQTEAGRV